MRVDEHLYATKPPAEDRLQKELAVYDLLDALEMEYVRVDHDAAMTIEECRAVDEILGISICKNLFLCNAKKSDFYLLMMPGEKEFKTKFLSKQIGSARLSFAPSEYMEEYLNVTPGSVSIMGLINDRGKHVRLLIDADVLKDETVGCHPCVNTASLRLKTKDVLEKFLPHVRHEPTVVHL